MREGSRSRSKHLNRKMPAHGKMRERPRGKEPVTLSTNQIDGDMGQKQGFACRDWPAHLCSFDAVSAMSKPEGQIEMDSKKTEKK